MWPESTSLHSEVLCARDADLGSLQPQGWTGPDGAVCTICPIGKFKGVFGSSDCLPATLGTFSDEQGLHAPERCPSHSYDPPLLGATSHYNCSCMEGFLAENRLCNACPAGTYKPTNGTSPCSPCPPGTFNEDTGQAELSSCRMCPYGTDSPPLTPLLIGCIPMPGFYSLSTGVVAEQCSPGYFKANNGTGLCNACPAGTLGAGPGNTECAACQNFSFSLPGSSWLSSCICDPGYTGEDGGVCEKCRAGTFKPVNGSQFCDRCPFGEFSMEEGATMPGVCTPCSESTVTTSQCSFPDLPFVTVSPASCSLKGSALITVVFDEVPSASNPPARIRFGQGRPVLELDMISPMIGLATCGGSPRAGPALDPIILSSTQTPIYRFDFDYLHPSSFATPAILRLEGGRMAYTMPKPMASFDPQTCGVSMDSKPLQEFSFEPLEGGGILATGIAPPRATAGQVPVQINCSGVLSPPAVLSYLGRPTLRERPFVIPDPDTVSDSWEECQTESLCRVRVILMGLLDGTTQASQLNVTASHSDVLFLPGPTVVVENTAKGKMQLVVSLGRITGSPGTARLQISPMQLPGNFTREELTVEVLVNVSHRQMVLKRITPSTGPSTGGRVVKIEIRQAPLVTSPSEVLVVLHNPVVPAGNTSAVVGAIESTGVPGTNSSNGTSLESLGALTLAVEIVRSDVEMLVLLATIPPLSPKQPLSPGFPPLSVTVPQVARGTVSAPFQVFIEGLTLACTSGCASSSLGGSLMSLTLSGFASFLLQDFHAEMDGSHVKIASWDGRGGLTLMFPSDPGKSPSAPVSLATVSVCGPPELSACSYVHVRYLRPPRVLSAAFFPAGDGILVRFDQTTNRNGVRACSRALEAEASSLGEAPKCFVSGDALQVTLGGGATIMPGDGLRVVLPDLRSADSVSSPAGALRAIVDRPDAPTVPAITVMGPSGIGACDTATIEAAALSPRACTFKYSCTHDSMLDAWLKREDRTDLVLLPGSVLEPNAPYQVTVIATNFLGEASQPAVHSIAALSPLPILLQIQVPLPPFYTTQPPALDAIVSLSSCDNHSTVVHSWQVATDLGAGFDPREVVFRVPRDSRRPPRPENFLLGQTHQRSPRQTRDGDAARDLHRRIPAGGGDQGRQPGGSTRGAGGVGRLPFARPRRCGAQHLRAVSTPLLMEVPRGRAFVSQPRGGGGVISGVDPGVGARPRDTRRPRLRLGRRLLGARESQAGARPCGRCLCLPQSQFRTRCYLR